MMKLPRKIKKELKKKILYVIDVNWRSKDIKITQVEKHSRYSHINATHRRFTVTSYSLSINL